MASLAYEATRLSTSHTSRTIFNAKVLDFIKSGGPGRTELSLSQNSGLFTIFGVSIRRISN